MTPTTTPTRLSANRVPALLLLGLLFIVPPAAADDTAIDPWLYIYAGMEHFYNLEYDQAIADYQSALALDPNNVRFLNFLTNTYLFQELYRLGQLDGNLYSSSNAFLKSKKPKPGPEQMKRIRENIARVKKLCEARLEENRNDVEALYALGIAYAIEGNMKFTIEKKFMDALRAGTKAHNLHEKVLKLDPDFHDAKLVPGIYQYVVGSLPWYVKVAAFFLGHRGDKQKGVRLIHEAITKGRTVSIDATVLLSLGYTREKMHRYSRQLMEKLSEYYPRNYLYHLEIGRSFQREDKRLDALRVYQDVARRSKNGAPGYGKVPLSKLYFEIGAMHQQRREYDQALDAFERAGNGEKADGRVRAYSHLRRGEIFLEQKKTDRAREEFQRVTKTGYEEPSKQARKHLRKLPK